MNPILNSLLDYDAYKTTMAQLIWRKHLDVQAVFALNNRTKNVNLLDYIDINELRAQIEHVRTLRFKKDELEFLTQHGADTEFTDYLENVQLPEVQIGIEDGRLAITAEGQWVAVTFWETIILAIVNELYAQGRRKQMGLDEEQVLEEGRQRLDKKIQILKAYPGIKIIEFGTRRRYSSFWQREVTQRLKEAIPSQLAGVSNEKNALDFGLMPIGTFAHEMPMGYSAIYRDLQTNTARGHKQMLLDWWAEFGFDRSIALTDTFGSNFFFKDFREMAAEWKGLRHDSGDPFVFGEQAIAYYQELGINPAEKLIVFSDGLDINLIVQLYLHFAGRIQMSFGWGTNLTNDVGIPTLSLVVKLIRADGRGTVKLSDNLAKALGAKEDIKIAKKLFSYTNTLEQALVV